tara:strand:- start:883 stop:1575 length:693 start_codon:yes stop_codon:yes gene_type:complete
MIQTSIYTLIGILFSKRLAERPYLITSLIIGLIFPDIDIILDFIFSLFLNFNFIHKTYIDNSIFHSLLLIPFICLIILMYQEVNKNKNYNIVVGFSAGVLMHILFDILTLQSVGIFFPLPLEKNLNLNVFFNYKIPLIMINILNLLTLMLFRLYTWKIINLILNQSQNYHILIKRLSLWMKIQLYLFLIFIFLIYFDTNGMINSVFFGASYTLSFAMVVYMTFKTKKLIN